jgi:hypothetical protein
MTRKRHGMTRDGALETKRHHKPVLEILAGAVVVSSIIYTLHVNEDLFDPLGSGGSGHASTSPSHTREAQPTAKGCKGIIADMMAGKMTAKMRGCSDDPHSPFSLDASGRQIPTTNYSIPAGAVFISPEGNDANGGSKASPLASLQAALDKAPNKGTVVVRGGEYRQGGARSSKTVTIQAYPQEQAWFDGTVPVPADKWQRDANGRYTTSWSTPEFCGGKYYSVPLQAQQPDNSGPCAHFDMSRDPGNLMAVDPQMVFADGDNIHEVASYDQATGDNFYYDQDGHRLVLGFNPAGRKIEATKYASALILGGDGSSVKGIGFRRGATNEWEGNLTNAFVYGGADNLTFENIAMVQMAAQALTLAGRNATVSHSVFVHNGYNGIGGNGTSKLGIQRDNLRITDSMFAHNVTEKFGTDSTVSTGQSGVKVAHMNGAYIGNNVFYGNQGYGYWCDLNCKDNVMVSNLLVGNKRGGLLYEASSGGLIGSNVMINSGQYGLRAPASDTDIINNTIINSKENADVWIYDDPRYSGKNGNEVGPDTRHVRYINNVSFGRVASIRLSGSDANGTNTFPSQFFDEYDSNAYFRTGGPSQTLVWYEAPDKRARLNSLHGFQGLLTVNGHPIDVHGIAPAGENPFASLKNGDLRIVRGAANASGAPVPADIAQLIGITARTGRDRGALIWPGM